MYGTNRARTCDPLLVRQVLSQLSYDPVPRRKGLPCPATRKVYYTRLGKVKRFGRLFWARKPPFFGRLSGAFEGAIFRFLWYAKNESRRKTLASHEATISSNGQRLSNDTRENSMAFNENIRAIAPSESVTLLARAKELQKTDPEILNLTGGEPDFPTPRPICDEVTRQLAVGNTHYSDSRGNESLRERIAKKLTEENGAPYPKEQILVTPGGKMAIYLAVRALTNPGDEVMWLAPGWVSYAAIASAAGAVPVAVPLSYEENYALTRQALESAVSAWTKLLIINYPNNPTGRILTETDIAELSAFLAAHPEVWLLSDEIYEKIVFDGKRVVSMASFPEFFDRTIVVNGFSKCSAMTGWRIGYLACPPDLYEMVWRLFQHTMSCTSGFLQEGARVALDCAAETEAMRKAYERRRNLLVEGIRDIPKVELRSPDGAFYAWVRFETERTSREISERFLDVAKVAGVPGAAYGEEEAVCVRFSFAAPEEELRKLPERLRKFAETEL